MTYEEARTIWLARVTGGSVNYDADGTPATSEGKGGRMWLNDLVAERPLVEALVTIGRHKVPDPTAAAKEEFWRPQDDEGNITYHGPMLPEHALQTVEGKPNGVFQFFHRAGTRHSLKEVDWAQLARMEIDGETCLDELEAILVLWPQ